MSASPASPSLLRRAADILREHRSGSAALLQRHLKIGYGDAMRLIAQLASVGLVEAPNPDGRYRFHCSSHLRLARTDSERHARLLRDLALYLIECRGGLDTRCVDLLLQSRSCDLSVLRDAVTTLEPGAPHPVLALARSLASHPQLAPSASCEDWGKALDAVCVGVEPLPHHLEGTPRDRLYHSLVRAVRYMEMCLEQRHAPHSRCLEYFVHEFLLPQGRGLEGNPTYGEHVVPCVLLCAEATRMLQHTLPVEEVAEWIQPYLRVVWIDPQFAAGLDGELKLKATMPLGWEFGRGCIYARLHAADILFTPPEAGPECCGWPIDRHG